MSLLERAFGLPLEKVRFSFEPEDEPETAWRVVELRATEELSGLYSCTLDLASEDLGADPDALLGGSCQVTLWRGASARRLCGIVDRVEHLQFERSHAFARVHVVPALLALSYRRDSHIFQEMAVPEILEEVLGEGLEPFQRTCRMDLQRRYLAREYCVQYQESDLDFALRLMEEEGISFYFDHSQQGEELVLFDDSRQCAPCETAFEGPVTFRRSDGMPPSEETLAAFEHLHQMRTTGVVARDFDWTHPQVDLTRNSGRADGRGRERESYEYPAPMVGPYDAGSKRYDHDADHQAQLRAEAHGVREKCARGTSDVTGLTPGYSFDLVGHGRPGLDRKYLITRVEHEGSAPKEVTSEILEAVEGEPERRRYSNAFECIPFTVPFRPERRRARARIHGLQTATVVGPQGEEVFTDEHGRIKVQFHWDREGERNDRSSCFLRVGQAWAGAGFGTFFLPRVGMEVLVGFLEGDPDRPVVLGCVYNGENPTPYALADHKTRSTLKTLSSPGGNGYNELRFEDAAGNEEVFLHAQKDLNETVEHDHSTTVHGAQTNTVDGNQTEKVKGEQSMTVDKNRTVQVKGSQSVKIDGGEANAGVTGSKLDITGDYKVDASQSIEVQAPQHIKFTVGRSSVLIEPGKITLEAGDGSQVVLDAEALMKSNGRSQVHLNADAEMKSSGQSKVFLNANAEMTASGQGKVLLTGDAEMSSSGGSRVQLNGSAMVHGAQTATMEAQTSATVHAATATLQGQGGKVETNATGAAASGGTVTVSGDSTVTVTGGMIKLN
ncbi:MAG TPA: type VI secretion system tip protein TssI/VgrG [Myxococcales bacterium]|nr:type VI secretion system tip protein TssI/VgrG [Myxococcales bacterium]